MKFARKNKNDLIEIVDIETGNVVKIQSTYKEVKDDACTQVKTDIGLVLVEKGLNVDNVPRCSFIQFSPNLMDIICQKIAEGDSLTNICNEPDMPGYNTLSRWRREHPKVAEMIQHARRDRAENHYTRVLEEADGADEDNVQANKLRVTAYQWAAGVDNPEVFGAKTKISGDKDAPVQFIIDTGIRNASDYHKDESQKDVTPQEISTKDSDGSTA